MKRILAGMILILIFIISAQGCVYITHYKELMFLKRFSNNQREIEKYLDSQEKSFYRLRGDVVDNRLNKGLPEKDILSMYGQPVFCRSSESDGAVNETCFYRHPTRYLSTDMIYLNFDAQKQLESWKLIKGEN